MDGYEHQPPDYDWVDPDGRLRDRVMARREVLYVNRFGQAVERFSVRHGEAMTSYIFKPMEQRLSLLRELWLQAHLFPRLPICIPKLVTWSRESDSVVWAVFADVGRLHHRLSAKDVEAAAETIWLWQHSGASLTLPGIFDGQKPRFPQARETVQQSWNTIDAMLTEMKFSKEDRERLRNCTDTPSAVSLDEEVLVHGDYHFENVARLMTSMVVLDWEFVHVGSLYWDLYTLLDMPHPRYRKSVTDEVRLAALDRFVTVRKAAGYPVPSDFVLSYFQFTCVYSLWMLCLIREDRLQARWTEAELDGCQIEVGNTLQACTPFLH